MTYHNKIIKKLDELDENNKLIREEISDIVKTKEIEIINNWKAVQIDKFKTIIHELKRQLGAKDWNISKQKTQKDKDETIAEYKEIEILVAAYKQMIWWFGGKN